MCRAAQPDRYAVRQSANRDTEGIPICIGEEVCHAYRYVDGVLLPAAA